MKKHTTKWLFRSNGIKSLLLMLLLLVMGVGESVGQEPVNNRSASLSGRSMEYWGNSKSACLVRVANDSETRQQWIMENAGNGSFYLLKCKT